MRDKKHPRNPYLAVDVIVPVHFCLDGFGKIVLVSRGNEPKGLALPGGYVDYGESVEAAAVREVKEELCLDIESLTLVGVYSDPKRDPRQHIVSVAFVCDPVKKMPEAGDDAIDCAIVDVRRAMSFDLCFDHNKILVDWVNQVQKRWRIRLTGDEGYET